MLLSPLNLKFHDTETLNKVAAEHVKKGLFLRVNRGDEDEPTLAFLDRLRGCRSDWHPAIAQTLTAIAQQGTVGATAVADFFATAKYGFCFRDVLHSLCVQGWKAQTSDICNHFAGRGVVDQAALQAHINTQSKCMALDTWRIIFDKPKKVFDGSRKAGRNAAIANAIVVGRRSRECILGFLRFRALFCLELRSEIAEHLERLWFGKDPKGWFCVLEYLASSHDLYWVRSILERIVSDVVQNVNVSKSNMRFRIDEPRDWPQQKKRAWSSLPIALGHTPSFSEVAIFAQQRLEKLDSTAPSCL